MSHTLVKIRVALRRLAKTTKLLIAIVVFCFSITNSHAPKANAAFAYFQNAKQKKKPPAQETPPDTSSDTLPKLEDMLKNIPTRKQLLEKRFDWVVKGTDEVIVCEPVKMRPNTLERIPQEVAKLGKKNLSPEDFVEARDALEKISIIPLDDEESTEYLIDYRRVKQIIYHEDLLLKRIEIMQNKGNLVDSYQLLFDLMRRVPNWPGINKVFNRQILHESQQLNRKNKHALALTLLEDMFKRNKAFPGLDSELGVSCEALISTAVRQKRYRKSRYFLSRLIAMLPNHPVSKKWEKTLSDLAERSMNQALSSFDKKRYSQAVNEIEEAADIWPKHPRVKIEYARIKNRYQTLRVGVLNFPTRDTKFPFRTIADDRERYLTQHSIFEAERVDGFILYSNPFFEKWIPSDLGRKLVFKVNRNRAYWQTRPNLSANEIANTLKARIDPRHPEYDERLESYIKSISVVSPGEFRVVFKRNPPRLESLLKFPVIDPLVRDKSSTVSQENKVELPIRKNLLSRRFQPAAAERWTEHESVYKRFRPEPDGVGQYHVGEVYEKKYASYFKAQQAFVRGEVDLLPHIQSWDLTAYQNDKNFNVIQYAVPLNHTLQFNPKSFLLQHREMRRALRIGIDREGILRGIILREPVKKPDRGRVVTAPFSPSSYAYNSGVEAKQYDPILAMTLSMTAKNRYLVKHKDEKDKKTMPVIKMIVDPNPIAQIGARAIVRSWKKSKIDVKIIPIGETIPDNWDIIYRVSKMVDPVVDLWPFLTLENRARVDALEKLPDWIRQQLIRLEYARSWNDALSILHTIHYQLSKEAYMIPLWEVDDYMVYRRGILGPKKNPLFTYQGIESWRVPASLSQ